MPTSAVNKSPSNNSPSSIMQPLTLKLGKLLHPPPTLCSQSARLTIPVASSASPKSLRCDTSGPNSRNPPVYRVYNHGLPSSLSLWPDCASPRTEGPNAPARSKHTIIKFLHLITPRFPPINRSPSSPSLCRFHISSAPPVVMLSFG